MARVTLVRHAKYDPSQESGISEEGAQLAKELGKEMGAQDAPTVIGHSLVRRTAGTAEALAQGVSGIAESPRVIEVPALSVKEREVKAFFLEKHPDAIYRELDRLVSLLEKSKDGKVARLVFVSHSPHIMKILREVFGNEFSKMWEKWPHKDAAFGDENVDIKIYRPIQDGIVPLKVRFGEDEKLVMFDRKQRKILTPEA